MRRLLRPKDILMLALAGAGDLFEEVKDPLHLVSNSYKEVYGFVPRKYKRNNFYKTVSRSLKTGDMEKIVKDDEIYLRLTSAGNMKIKRDFPIVSLTKVWNGKWTIVSFDIDEKARGIRDRFRNKLKSIGFGMLQESVWISPLPIEKEVLELVESNGLSLNTYVFEVAGMLFGNPQELVRKVWKINEHEKEFNSLKEEMGKIEQLSETLNGRDKKREEKISDPSQTNSTNKKLIDKDVGRLKRELNRKYLSFVMGLPLLPLEFYPFSLKYLRKFT